LVLPLALKLRNPSRGAYEVKHLRIAGVKEGKGFGLTRLV